MGADILEKGGLTHDLCPTESPFRRTYHPVHRVVNPGPADPFTEVEVDGGLFPSAGAAKLGIEVVPPPVVLAEVSMACTVLNKLAQQGAGELELLWASPAIEFPGFGRRVGRWQGEGVSRKYVDK